MNGLTLRSERSLRVSGLILSELRTTRRLIATSVGRILIASEYDPQKAIPLVQQAIAKLPPTEQSSAKARFFKLLPQLPHMGLRSFLTAVLTATALCTGPGCSKDSAKPQIIQNKPQSEVPPEVQREVNGLKWQIQGFQRALKEAKLERNDNQIIAFTEKLTTLKAQYKTVIDQYPQLGSDSRSLLDESPVTLPKKVEPETLPSPIVNSPQSQQSLVPQNIRVRPKVVPKSTFEKYSEAIGIGQEKLLTAENLVESRFRTFQRLSDPAFAMRDPQKQALALRVGKTQLEYSLDNYIKLYHTISKDYGDPWNHQYKFNSFDEIRDALKTSR